MRTTTSCRECGGRLSCSCCGIYPHESFCDLFATTCQDCLERIDEQGPALTDADEPQILSFIKDMSLEEIDRAAARIEDVWLRGADAA